MIRENLEAVEEKIRAACERSGRKREEVTLIAVSKFKPVSDIREAMAAGQLDFGENRAQEMAEKKEELGGDIRWHFIGNLQKNKVRTVVGRAELIHSVNSLPLAEEIARVAGNRGLTVPVLVEVNIADEATKHGLAKEEAVELVRAMSALPELSICGLMAIAPPVENGEENRPYFRALKALSEEIEALQLPGVKMRELSMGMSGDYETAIEEGATLIRVGTAIFGSRNSAST